MVGRVPYNLAHAQLAQMDRASASEAEGHWFDSSTAHQLPQGSGIAFRAFSLSRRGADTKLSIPTEKKNSPEYIVPGQLMKNGEKNVSKQIYPCKIGHQPVI